MAAYKRPRRTHAPDDGGASEREWWLAAFKPYVVYHRPYGCAASRRFADLARLYPQIDARIDYCDVDNPGADVDGIDSDECRLLGERRRRGYPIGGALPVLIDEAGEAHVGYDACARWFEQKVLTGGGGGTYKDNVHVASDIDDADERACFVTPMALAATPTFIDLVPPTARTARPINDMVADYVKERATLRARFRNDIVDGDD